MPINARYVHTNLIARDWKRLVRFYRDVFGCEPAPPERHHHGEWLERVTGLPGAELRGLHLRLPGYGADGPTLEIFEYVPPVDGSKPAINHPGFAHIAFVVDDVPSARQAVLAAGGSDLGEVVRHTIPGAGEITLVYMRDPEGNLLELQQWSGK